MTQLNDLGENFVRKPTRDLRIVVVGLGYVGLPLAVALARQFSVVGLDINSSRIRELRRNFDRTAEVDALVLADSGLALADDGAEAAGADIYIITVPTPVDDNNKPDLRPVMGASRDVAKMLDPTLRPVIVFESTVYPGVTEDVCAPLIEDHSGLQCGRDFFLGYSPERINPGDKENTIDRIVKVVAGQTDDVTDLLCEIYGKVTRAGVYRAASIKTAEAAKVIENAQRDINIAFMNEIAQIFSKLKLSVWDVLDAAATKWNFLQFQPGLVGGHCIGVDPYYLSHRARQLGHEPEVILAGRSINDTMGRWVADSIHSACANGAGTALILGVTFKENVPDLRNSRVIDVIRRLTELGHQITVHDPRADAHEAHCEYGLNLDPDALSRSYDLVFAAVPHLEYASMTREEILSLVREGGCVGDLKGMWRGHDLGDSVVRWSL